MKKSIEPGIRLKAILIYMVIAAVCCGMIFYAYDLRRNIAEQREHIEQYRNTLTLTNEFVHSVNQAQSDANLYVTTKNTAQLSAFHQKIAQVEQLVDSLEITAEQPARDSLLQEIGVLLKKKGTIVSSLNQLFADQKPIDSIGSEEPDHDELAESLQVTTTTTVKDTAINTVKKGFWRRVSDVFSPGKAIDTVATVSTRQIDTVKLLPAKNPDIVSKMNDIAEKVSSGYSARIAAIEKQVAGLIVTDQEISAQLSTLLNELSRRTINLTLNEIRKSEQLIRKSYVFAMLGGGISLVLILIFVILIINDVNKGQAARKALEQANARIKTIMEGRHRLLLSVSHDIKTPLSSILGYLELQQPGAGIPQKQLSSMQNSGKHILALLENLLEFSSLEQGTLAVYECRFNLWELCSETREMFAPLALQKNLSFDGNFPGDKTVEICSDALKIKQIIINILSNAVKYTSEGGISFRTTFTDGKLYFCVDDTGAGIPADKMDVLFKPFARAEENNSLASGSGLGMYVVKGLVDLLRGEINVASVPGKGTRVEVTIPVKVAPKKETAGAGAKKILLVDDDPALLAMLRDMLAKSGHRVDICSNPANFDRYKANLSEYDLVITDMEMGAVSGTDILKKARSGGKKPIVVAMTGRSDFGEATALDAGFDGYLSKPVTMNALNRLTAGGPDHFAGGLESLEEMFDGDRDAINRILEVFVRSTEENIVTLSETIAGDDFRKAQALCHKMLPMFMQVGATECIDFLKQMDASRSESAEKHPFWKGKASDFIGKTEKLMIRIREEYLGK